MFYIVKIAMYIVTITYMCIENIAMYIGLFTIKHSNSFILQVCLDVTMYYSNF